MYVRSGKYDYTVEPASRSIANAFSGREMAVGQAYPKFSREYPGISSCTVPDLMHCMPCSQVVNAGDTMEFLSGGYYKATIHRVVQPPKDQRGYPRLGIFYFTVTDDGVRLAPLTESPVLQRVGVKRRFPDAEAPTMEEWRKARTIAYGTSKLTKEKSGHEVEIVNGIQVKHFN